MDLEAPGSEWYKACPALSNASVPAYFPPSNSSLVLLGMPSFGWIFWRGRDPKIPSRLLDNEVMTLMTILHPLFDGIWGSMMMQTI